MCRDQCRPENHVPQGAATTCDSPSSAKGSAVVRNGGQSGERGSPFAGDDTDFGHISDQHCVGNRANPRDWTEVDGHL